MNLFFPNFNPDIFYSLLKDIVFFYNNIICDFSEISVEFAHAFYMNLSLTMSHIK